MFVVDNNTSGGEYISLTSFCFVLEQLHLCPQTKYFLVLGVFCAVAKQDFRAA